MFRNKINGFFVPFLRAVSLKTRLKQRLRGNLSIDMRLPAILKNCQIISIELSNANLSKLGRPTKFYQNMTEALFKC